MVDHLSLRKRGVFVNLPICRIPRGSDFYLLLASESVVETWTGSCGLVNTYVLLHLGYIGHACISFSSTSLVMNRSEHAFTELMAFLISDW
jgi:hypothetical protein